MDLLSKKIVLAVIIIFQTMLFSCVGNNSDDLDGSESNSQKLLRILRLDIDQVQPEIDISPGDGVDNVSPNTAIVIYFNHPVDEYGDWQVTIDSVVYTMDSSVIEWDTWFDENGQYYMLIIRPEASLPREQTVTVSTQGFRFRDYYIYFDDITSQFTTAGGGALKISMMPSTGTINVLSDANVKLKFSEYTDGDSDWQVVIDGVTYHKSSPEIYWDVDHVLLTINPMGYFPRKGTVSVTATGFAASCDGYPFPDASGSFTIVDSPGTIFNPVGEEKAVPLNNNILITFSEPMVIDDNWSVNLAGTVYEKGSSTVSWSADHMVLTIDPVGNLPVMSQVTVTLQEFHAEKDNALFAGPSTNSFFTCMLIEKIDAAIAWRNDAIISSVIDSADAIHISYADYRLNHITNKSGTWQYQEITSGQSGSMAVDSDDAIHIAYEAHIDGDVNLGYVNNAGGSWMTEIVDGSNLVGYEPSIAIDKNDFMHLLYWDRINCIITYASNIGGSWALQSIEDLGSWDSYPSSIVVDQNGTVQITYYTGTILKYGRYQDDMWELSTVDSAQYAGGYNDSALDSNGAVHVAYNDFDYSSHKYRMKYATNKSGSWTSIVIDPNGVRGAVSIAIDSNDKVHIAYINNGDGPSSGNYKTYIKYVTNKNGPWDMYWVESGNSIGDNCSLSLDSDGYPHIIYTKVDASCELKHATNRI